MRTPILLLSLLFLSCASSISTLQPAQTLKEGAFHLSMGLEVPIPASQLRNAVDTAKDIQDDIKASLLADPNFVPTDEQQRDLLNAAVGLGFNGLMTPQPVLIARYGIRDDLDAGIYYSGASAKVDAKFRFLNEKALTGAISIGVSKSLMKGVVFDLLEKIKVEDFSRYDVHIPILFGGTFGSMGRYWFGPKYIYSKVKIDAKITNIDDTLNVDHGFHYVGGLVGASFGYKYAFVFAEITAMHLTANPTILGEETDLGGLVLMPAAGLSLEY
ncbi:MAG: hypothetical protein CMH54_01830 [Myxococcales bacterium]|nr:hypothetical protein [Myxococcales bacterium]